MTVEEILTALRMVAMGRPGHPEVVALAEFLAVKLEPAEVVGAKQEDKPARGRKKAD